MQPEILSTRSRAAGTAPDQRSVVNHIETIILRAHTQGASDIHINPGREALWVQFRIDGLLCPVETLPLVLHDQVISRLKVLAGLRTDEHHTAQDGRFRYDLSEHSWIDIRLAIVPTYYGENAVLRLLSSTHEALDLSSLGFSDENVSKLTQTINRPYGLVLVTGPTGSGKTTTLYTLLRLISQRPVSIVTIEDPVEYSIDGVNQVPTNSRLGLTFAHGLRSILRQDPDVIMIGEIRDTETARLAASAALTGHLVLSTLHTNDATSALTRLIDLGVEPYLVASTVSMVVAQRLVRRICDDCKHPIDLPALEHAYLLHTFGTYGPVPKTLFKGAGCSTCSHTGYRGRVGIYELFSLNQKIRADIRDPLTEHELRVSALHHGMKPLAHDCLLKAKSGTTTVEELLKIHDGYE